MMIFGLASLAIFWTSSSAPWASPSHSAERARAKRSVTLKGSQATIRSEASRIVPAKPKMLATWSIHVGSRQLSPVAEIACSRRRRMSVKRPVMAARSNSMAVRSWKLRAFSAAAE
ncbi:hypothetical protein D3C83_57670 [compost metagenome]